MKKLFKKDNTVIEEVLLGDCSNCHNIFHSSNFFKNGEYIIPETCCYEIVKRKSLAKPELRKKMKIDVGHIQGRNPLCPLWLDDIKRRIDR